MPHDLLWLLLPVAAASGWYAARRSSARVARASVPMTVPEYFKGITYLLDEKPDKAIETFVKMLEIDSQSVEPHFALGNLFRRQGEVDRAIRIHQNLIARPTLSREHRDHALFELAEDYLQAGLLDRAEHLFGTLVEKDTHAVAAMQRLQLIFEQEHEWENAIEIAQRLQSRGGGSLKKVISQYYCELAEQAMTQGDGAQARKLLRRALSQDSTNVRASLLGGRLSAEGGNDRQAIREFLRVAEQDPAFLAEVITPLLECAERAGRLAQISDVLHAKLMKQGMVRPVAVLVDYLRRTGKTADAQQLLEHYLAEHNSLPALQTMLDFRLRGDGGEEDEPLRRVREIVAKAIEDVPHYLCGSCGYRGRIMHWQCPGCRRWNSVRPATDPVTLQVS